MRISLLFLLFTGIYSCLSQVGIGTELVDNSAMLEIPSETKGILLPRVTTIQQNSILLPANSLIVYNTDTNTFNYNRGTSMLSDWITIADQGTVTSYIGQSAKFSNIDTTTDINNVALIKLPVFGIENWNDNGSLFLVSGNTLRVVEAGRYEINTNVSFKKTSNSIRKAPEVYLLVNGTRMGSYATTGYIRRNDGHNQASLHLNEVIELNANDIVSIAVIRTANAGKVKMRSVGSSDFFIEKKK